MLFKIEWGKKMYKVVVVEDEKIIRKGLIYSIHWEEFGCSVVGEARNGIEGIDAIKEHNPNIVVADINMPIMDGLEMIRQTCEEYDYAPIILSGYSDFEYARKAIQYGVTSYLLKPLNKEEIKDAIKIAQRECEVRQAYLNNKRDKEDWRRISLLNEYPIKKLENPVVKEMLEYIYENYQNKIVMQDVVDYLNYSETFLNKKFKESIGTTFIEYLNRYRIQKAIELLQDENNSIQDVASKCGNWDYKYFGTVFRKYIGCSPSEYLREISK